MLVSSGIECSGVGVECIGEWNAVVSLSDVGVECIGECCGVVCFGECRGECCWCRMLW